MNSLQPSAFNLAPSPTLQWQPVRNSNFLAIANNAYPCNTTSAAFTVTLPTSPAAGNVITLTDYAGTWDTNYLTVNPNGLKINGNTNNATLSSSRGSVQLVYVDATQGWVAYSGFAVTTLPQLTPSIDYLVVAGGGGVAGNRTGGGGAGGYLEASSVSVSGVTSLTITVGAGGAGGSGIASASATQDGSNSVISGTGFTTVTATGGGGGNSVASNGRDGGSGGGGGGAASSTNGGTNGNGVAGPPRQGYNGGTGNTQNSDGNGAGGGGGGAGGVGGNGVRSPSIAAGAGGLAKESTISGSSVYYAGGGGGGGGGTATAGLGGGTSTSSQKGGGGDGATGTPNTQLAGAPGGTNTGGGAGGGSNYNITAVTQASGGSGVVFIRYPDTYAAAASTTGSPTITVAGGYRIYKWTGNGSITF